MATVAGSRLVGVERFWLISACLMALVLVAGFSIQLAAGRSSFAVPLYVHAHALIFFGWVALYVTQNLLVGRDYVALHRRLGWLAVGWIPAMVAMGIFITLRLVQAGHVPFFFTPLYFLIMNPLSVLTFAGLASTAIVMRRRTQWHRRLMFCAMAILLGPGFGRLLPVPFMIPHVGWGIFAALILFPIAGVIRDLRTDGKVHPAWLWGIGAIVAAQVAMDLISASAVGQSIYQAATRGTPGAAVAPLVYPPFPPTPGGAAG